MNIETFTQLISQATGSFSSWQSIASNILFAILLRFLLHSPYATLNSMSDLLLSISQCLFLISLYCLIYKSVGAVGNFISAYRNQIKTKAAAIKNETDIRTTLDILSPKEIGIIKFILRQDLFIAWLPHDYLPVLLLEKKNILSNVDHTATKNIPLEHGASINQTCSLYTINENILRVITASSIEKSIKWKKAKVDNRFKPFQDD